VEAGKGLNGNSFVFYVAGNRRGLKGELGFGISVEYYA